MTTTGYEITSNRGAIPSSTDNAKNTPKSIEEFEEQQEKEAEALSFVGGGIGDRKTPEYTMNYQQSVTAEDVFLQVGIFINISNRVSSNRRTGVLVW